MEYWLAGHYYIDELDEVARRAFAGNVVAAAVILPVGDSVLCNARRAAGRRDSKKGSARQRERLDGLIRELALAVAVGEALKRLLQALVVRASALPALVVG